MIRILQRVRQKIIVSKSNELPDYFYQLLFTYVIMIVISFVGILYEIKNGSWTFIRTLDILSDSLFPTTITFLTCLLIEKKFYQEHRFWYSISILIIMGLMANYKAYMDIKYSQVGNHIFEIKLLLFFINFIGMVFSFFGIIRPCFVPKQNNCDGQIYSDKKGKKINK